TYVGEDPGTPKAELVKTPTTDKDPEIVSKTWAKKIETYTGAFNKPVPHIFSLTFADAIESVTNAASIVNLTNAASLANLNNSVNNFDFTLGIKESIQIGLALNLFLGAKLDLFPTPWVTFSLDTKGFHNMKTEATNAENRLVNMRNDITSNSNAI